MTNNDRLHTVLLATSLGPITPFYGICNGQCECGKPQGPTHKPGKHPRFADWQNENASTNPDIIRSWVSDHPEANFAVIAGVETVVLDLDVRPGKNGVAELAAIEATQGQTLPPTVTVFTGSGSGAKHLYFKIPAGVESLRKPKGTKGIDFLRTRQAVILPGSRHESGGRYVFAPGLSSEEIDLADLPDWFLELMESGQRSRQVAYAGPENVEQLFDHLLSLGPPPGSIAPGRLRDDEIVRRKMRTVPMRRYPSDRSHSDSHWAWTLARNCCHHWEQYLRLWTGISFLGAPAVRW